MCDDARTRNSRESQKPTGRKKPTPGSLFGVFENRGLPSRMLPVAQAKEPSSIQQVHLVFYGYVSASFSVGDIQRSALSNRRTGSGRGRGRDRSGCVVHCSSARTYVLAGQHGNKHGERKSVINRCEYSASGCSCVFARRLGMIILNTHCRRAKAVRVEGALPLYARQHPEQMPAVRLFCENPAGGARKPRKPELAGNQRSRVMMHGAALVSAQFSLFSITPVTQQSVLSRWPSPFLAQPVPPVGHTHRYHTAYRISKRYI